MGLLEAIPGLAAHQVEQSIPDLDQRRAEVLIRNAYGLVSSMYPPGAMEWLREFRPEVVRYLKECEADVDGAVLAGDQARLEKGLDRWAEAHKRAFGVFRGRPPVIERDAASPAAEAA